MEVLAKNSQTLADIAIQEYGCLEAVVKLSLDNGKSVSEMPTPGAKLQLHQHIYNKVLQNIARYIQYHLQLLTIHVRKLVKEYLIKSLIHHLNNGTINI